MDTQISTNDWILKVESKNNESLNIYTKRDIEYSKPLIIKGHFPETKKICFTYRLDKNENYCNLIIPKCQDKIIRENSGDKRTFKFSWIPVNFAGVFDVVFEITTDDDTKQTFSLRLDVISKLDYGDNNNNFHYLLNSLRKKHLEIFRFFNPSKIPKNIGQHPPTPYEQFEVLERNMEKLENIVYQISLNPNKKLIKEQRRDKFYALDTIDHNIIYDIATQGGGLIRVPNDLVAPELLQDMLKDASGNKHLPDNVIVYRTLPTYNVFENQLLKRFLTLISLCSKIVEATSKLEKVKYRDSPESQEIEILNKYIDKCQEYHKKTIYMKQYSFLDEVQETDNITYHTPVLQSELNYMRFYSIFKDFIGKTIFDFSEQLNLPIIDIPTLYEYWTVIQVVDILAKLDGWDKKEHIIKKNELGYLFRLRSGKNSLIDISKEGKTLSLYYQKGYKTYANNNVRPDITLEMRIDGNLSKILLFDPKYRSKLDAGDINDPESAINKMHVYKDAIRGDDGSHLVDSAYAIYLGGTQINSPLQDMNDGIGGIRLFPNENNETDAESLKEVIHQFSS